MKRLIAMALVALTAIESVSAEPTVTDVTAKQRYPWNGLVDISCKVSGIEAEAGEYEFVVVAVDKETGREYMASNFSIEHGGADMSGLDVSENGTYNLLWNAHEDLGQVVIERMTMRITLEAVAVSVGKVQLWEGGPYWADRNVGAKKPEDYGLYFWWGDTKGHRPSGGTFSFNFSADNSTIYTYGYGKSDSKLQSIGWVTSEGVLAPNHDAAHVKWGSEWRMPTYQELRDLNNKCDWKWTLMNGVKGYIVRGRSDYTSKSIFLPAAGRGGRTSFGEAGSYGFYWSSVPHSFNYYAQLDSYYNAYVLYLNSSYHSTDVDGFRRYYGFSVRPVQGFTK